MEKYPELNAESALPRMFLNVPDWLNDKVRGIRQTVNPSDRDSIYLHASGWVIAYYLHKNVASPAGDIFFDYRLADETGVLWHGHVNRVTLIGEALFTLRNCAGFSTLCRRLKDRDLRSTYFEMMAAKTFFSEGFEIAFRPESGQIGADFDFRHPPP